MSHSFHSTFQPHSQCFERQEVSVTVKVALLTFALGILENSVFLGRLANLNATIAIKTRTDAPETKEAISTVDDVPLDGELGDGVRGGRGGGAGFAYSTLILTPLFET